MSLFRTSVVLSLFLSCSAVALHAEGLPHANPEDVGVAPEKVGRLSTHLQSLVDRGLFTGGITLMARKGHVVHLEAVGAADLTGTPMRRDAIFRIASMTKPITSVAAMILCDEGKLHLDDPISKFIPEFENPEVLVGIKPWTTKPAGSQITVRHLLSHQSGLAYAPFSASLGPIYVENEVCQGLARTNISLDENVRRLAKLPLVFTPGEDFMYGLSTDVLGCVVQRASGQSLDVFMRERIFRPLGMRDTHFFLPEQKISRLVTAYELTEKGLDPVLDGQLRVWEHLLPYTADYAYRGPRTYLSGGAGLCSTLADYAVFCQMLLNGGEWNGERILKSATVREMMTNQIGDHTLSGSTDKFGLGFAIRTGPRPEEERTLVGACGWSGAWCTRFTISPRGDWFMICMVQTFANDVFTPETAAEFERIAARSVLPER